MKRKFLSTLFISLLFTLASNAQRITFFLETCGDINVSANTNLNSWTGWSMPGITITSDTAVADNYTTVRTTGNSSQITYPFYGNASGGNNILFSRSETLRPGITVKGIDVSAHTQLELQFGYRVERLNENPLVVLSVSPDNGAADSWIEVPCILSEADTGWYLSPVIPLPVEATASTIALKWKTSGACGYRLDDIRITGIPKNTWRAVSSGATDVSAQGFTANWDASPGADKYYLEVSTSPSFTSLDVDTVVGWNQKTTIASASSVDSILANVGTVANNGIQKIVRIGNPTDVARMGIYTVSYAANGAGYPAYAFACPNAFNSVGFQSANTIPSYYQIQANTKGYYNLKLSSIFDSSGAGPRNIKIQYRTGEDGLWYDVADYLISSATIWNIQDSVALPDACNNQENLYIRWLVKNQARATSSTSTVDSITTTGTFRLANVNVRGNAGSFIAGYEGKEITGPSDVISGLGAGTYYYRVRASKDGDYSFYSQPVSVVLGSSSINNTQKSDPGIYYDRMSEKLLVTVFSSGLVNVLDVNGRILDSFSSLEQSFSLSRYSSGLYFAVLDTPAGRKVIKFSK
ncbi:MAG: hypothetical protein LBH19_10695 [Dysgonamonadaceae bacterium]|jgi:hypothetical protein|nr:hypothetical protein [Dysgonamonadaceae bacterium]